MTFTSLEAAPSPRRGGHNPDPHPQPCSVGGARRERPSSPAPSGVRLVYVPPVAGRRYVGYVLPREATAERLPQLLRVLRGLSVSS